MVGGFKNKGGRDENLSFAFLGEGFGSAFGIAKAARPATPTILLFRALCGKYYPAIDRLVSRDGRRIVSCFGRGIVVKLGWNLV